MGMSTSQPSIDQPQAVDTVLSHPLKDPFVSAESELRGVKCSVCVCVCVFVYVWEVVLCRRMG